MGYIYKLSNSCRIVTRNKTEANLPSVLHGHEIWESRVWYLEVSYRIIRAPSKSLTWGHGYIFVYMQMGYVLKYQLNQLFHSMKKLIWTIASYIWLVTFQMKVLILWWKVDILIRWLDTFWKQRSDIVVKGLIWIMEDSKLVKATAFVLYERKKFTQNSTTVQYVKSVSYTHLTLPTIYSV